MGQPEQSAPRSAAVAAVPNNSCDGPCSWRRASASRATRSAELAPRGDLALLPSKSCAARAMGGVARSPPTRRSAAWAAHWPGPRRSTTSAARSQRATAPDPDLDPNADPNSASVPVPPRSRPGGATRGTCGSRTDSSRCSCCNSRTRNSRTRSSRASGSAARGLAGPDCWNPRTPTSRTRSSRTSGSAARGLPGPASARGRPALVQLLCHLPTPRAGA